MNAYKNSQSYLAQEVLTEQTRQTNARRGRFGPVELAIGATRLVKTPLPMVVRGRFVPAGTAMHFTAEDITRTPQAAPYAKWICKHVDCAGQEWATKAALIAAHAPERELIAKEETHLYFAVAMIPATVAVPMQADADGNVIAAAVEETPARLMILSDQE